MRINEILYFSPKYRYKDINMGNKDILIDAFKDRVIEFYLRPAMLLNSTKNAFATGVLCVTTIDFLARISLNSDKTGFRIKTWLTKNISKFNKEYSNRFYDEFRNGLVHEGRIKQGSQFSYDIGTIVYIENDIIIVNPDLLLKNIILAFNLYLKELENNNEAFILFQNVIKDDFKKDIIL